MNAKEELLDHIDGCEVKYIHITYQLDIFAEEVTLEGILEDVLPKLDFDYDDGYGTQKLKGTIWFADGTWSEREEYDGAEWWSHRVCPPLP